MAHTMRMSVRFAQLDPLVRMARLYRFRDCELLDDRMVLQMRVAGIYFPPNDIKQAKTEHLLLDIEILTKDVYAVHMHHGHNT